MIDPSRFYVIFVVLFFLIQAESDIIIKFCSEGKKISWGEIAGLLVNVVSFGLCAYLVLTIK